MDLAIRLSRPWSEFVPVVESYANCCDSLIIYEHMADEEINRTHIHMLMLKCNVSTDTLKNYIIKHLGKINKTDWSFKTSYGKPAKTVDKGFITYMSKGNLDPVYNKNIEIADIYELKASWVVPNMLKWNVTDGVIRVEGQEEEKRKTVFELQQECAERIDKNNVVEDEDIYEVISDVMRKNKHRTHMYDMINWFDNVRFLSRSKRNEFKNDVLAKIKSRNRI